MSEEAFPYIDWALADELVGPRPKEGLREAVAFMSAARRAGHLCIQQQGSKLYPSLSTLTRMADEALQKKIHAGLAEIPTANLEESIISFSKSYYFQKAWEQESSFLQEFQRVIEATPSLEIAEGKIEKEIEKLASLGRLLPEQAEAIRRVCQGTVTFICGGPGTGKTYTAGECLRILLESTAESGRELQVLLAAPTGKAAANLQASLQRALGPSGKTLRLTAQTLHALLGLGSVRQDRGRQVLMADLVLVDECSMVDARLMTELFSALPTGARLVLLGDKHQLPPVESGSFFSALSTSPQLERHILTLHTCLRTELQTLVRLAERVKLGDATLATDLPRSQIEGVSWRGFEPLLLQRQAFNRACLESAAPLLSLQYEAGDDSGELLRSLNQLRLLCPLRRGPYGVEYINRLIGQYHREQCRGNVVAPIMITKNDYRMGLFNGEVGALIRPIGREQQAFAFFPSASGEVRRIPALQLPRHELAYCMSVHKSQGSEFQKVILLLPPGSEGFGREVLYTGITRSRSALELWSTEEVLRATLERHGDRLSNCAERLGYSEGLKSD